MTALEARELTLKSQETLINDELNYVLKCVQSSIDNVNFSCNIYKPLHSNVRKILEEKGYEISIPRISENSRAEYEIKW
jgi:hypothetical protein